MDRGTWWAAVHGVAKSRAQLSVFTFTFHLCFFQGIASQSLLGLRSTAAAAKSLQLCPTLCNPIDSRPPGSPSLGFSRQEHWSVLPFPSPIPESEVAQSCLTLSNPMDCSLPGSSIHGVFQARVLEWGAIAFSGTYTLLLLLLSRFSRVRLCATP